jgi:hypothetical protein
MLVDVDGAFRTLSDVHHCNRIKSLDGEALSIPGEWSGFSLSGDEPSTSHWASDRSDLFVDHVEYDATIPLGGVASGTLLAQCRDEARSLRLEVSAAKPVFAKGRGRWGLAKLGVNIVDVAPILVLVEFAGGVCGGFAAVPFQVSKCWSADPAGASFVFSLRPTAARHHLQDAARALWLGSNGFMFGDCCLMILDDGSLFRYERTYAVSSGWEIWPLVPFTRFEVWHVTL